MRGVLAPSCINNNSCVQCCRMRKHTSAGSVAGLLGEKYHFRGRRRSAVPGFGAHTAEPQPKGGMWLAKCHTTPVQLCATCVSYVRVISYVLCLDGGTGEGLQQQGHGRLDTVGGNAGFLLHGRGAGQDYYNRHVLSIGDQGYVQRVCLRRCAAGLVASGVAQLHPCAFVACGRVSTKEEPDGSALAYRTCR